MVARAVGAQGGQFVRLMMHLAVPFEIAWFFGWIGRLKVGKGGGRLRCGSEAGL
ncbi:hypothetical protein [Neisseria elongata]|uniref:hypothetical protein n=1 Tax=Neisseria elongata TaxID=495 RepID=UPI0024B20CEC|nr:hypothetical protein [Neisseria elongata]